MEKEKIYLQSSYSEKFFTYNLLTVFLLFIFIIILFNDYPETEFEKLIYSSLIKERGIYSQFYPFQSQIISNLVMFLAPLSGFLLSLSFKYKPISKQELIEAGAIIEKNRFKIIIMQVMGVVGLFLFVSMTVFTVYIDYSPLSEVARKTTFIRDNVITVIFLSFLFYSLLMIAVFFFLITIFNLKRIFNYQYHFPYDRKDKIRLLMKNKRKMGNNNG